MQEKSGNKAFEVVTGLEPSLYVYFTQPSTIPLYEFVHSIPSCLSQQVYNNHYPSLRIVMEKRLHFTKHLLQSGCTSLLSFTCNTTISPSVSYNRQSYSFASTISTCYSHGLGTMNTTLLPTIYHVSVGAPSSQFIYRMR